MQKSTKAFVVGALALNDLLEKNQGLKGVRKVNNVKKFSLPFPKLH